MKKTLMLAAIALLFNIVIVNNVQAQDLAFHNAKATYAEEIMPGEYSFVKDTFVTKQGMAANVMNSTSGPLKEFNKASKEFKQFSRISKSFDKQYSGVSKVHWAKSIDGYVCYFIKDSLQHIMWYTNDGYNRTSMVSYQEHLLPKYEKRLVKKHYKDYTISVVNEIKQDGILVYFVTIENNQQIKQITICDGELQVYKEYDKAGK